ncbi:glutathione synthase, partial [Syncephalis plumigaleata]
RTYLFLKCQRNYWNAKTTTPSLVVSLFCTSKGFYFVLAIPFLLLNTVDSPDILLYTSSMDSYPPTLSSNQRNELLATSMDWGSAHGLIVGAPNEPVQRLVHAPFALVPSPFPRGCFEEARSLQALFNELMDRFLTDIFESVSRVDPFTHHLYDIYKKVKEHNSQQLITLGIHRSDYLLHWPVDATRPVIRQVEINTIAASFAALAVKTNQMHQFVMERGLDAEFNATKLGTSLKHHLPENQAYEGLAKGLALAHQLIDIPNSYVLMVTQPGERNRFDQRYIEYALWDSHKVPMIRRTLDDLSTRAILNPETKALSIDGMEISVIYFRSAYGPDDYTTESAWSTRLMLEQSRAVKCPTVAYQLAGAKKVQQVLAMPNMLERFFPDDEEACRRMRASFAGMYPLDDTQEGENTLKMALANPDDFVLKPQREGGGNNIYGQDIPPLLRSLSAKERSAYILMDLIRPPHLQNWLVRDGEASKANVVSELGIYGVWLKHHHHLVFNEPVGHLLRTKSVDTQEGGVATGYAVIDSPLLVEDDVYRRWRQLQ